MSHSTLSPGKHALRKGRWSAPGHVYLVTTTCLKRQRWFANPDIAGAVTAKLTENDLWGEAERLCWVLMPDHLHLLIRLGEDRSLPRLMQRIKAITSLTAHRIARKQGAVWMSGYHDRTLRADESLREAARYIAWNPVRAGIVEAPDLYPYWGAAWERIAEDAG